MSDEQDIEAVRQEQARNVLKPADYQLEGPAEPGNRWSENPR
jgi:hypothetical protein